MRSERPRALGYFAQLTVTDSVSSCSYFAYLTSLAADVTCQSSFSTIGVSVRLSDRSLHREEQKKFVKNCPQLGLNPRSLDHHANALSIELSQHSVASLNPESSWPLYSHALLILQMTKVQNVKWCMKQTKLTSEIFWPTCTRLAISRALE